jgi:hypothetical protein
MLAGLSMFEGMLNVGKIEFSEQRIVYAYSDNEALVKVLNKHRRQQLTVKDHYSPDIDIELQLLDTFKKINDMNIIVILQHVYGHQDKKTA